MNQARNWEELQLPVSFDKLRIIAKEKLDSNIFDYLNSKSNLEEIVCSNNQSWGISSPSVVTETYPKSGVTIEGKELVAPVMLAPIDMQCKAHPDGELAVAKAAADKGLPYIASTISSFSLEEIAEANEDGNRWFELSVPNDLELAKSFVQRAQLAGYQAIVITVDSSMFDNVKQKEKGYLWNRFKKGIGNYAVDPVFIPRVYGKSDDYFIKEMIKLSSRQKVSWEDIAYIKEFVTVPIYLKGISHPQDALKAKENGIDGIIVTNQGEKSTSAPVDTLLAIREMVGEELTILVDSCLRTGADIVKSLALGADAVLYGSPYVYGLALGGRLGVENVIDNLIKELKGTMALYNVSEVSQISENLLWRSGRS